MKISIAAGTAKLDFNDLSFDASEDKKHPNRLPFKGTLLVLDKPSDQPPHGADGHRILVPKDVVEKRLRGLIGMGVNVSGDLQGHDQEHKIGVITSAQIVGDKVKVQGHIWKKDFPESADDVKGNRSLGMSMELSDVLIQNRDSDIWTIVDFQFTGATILDRESAAYWSTTLAASAERIRQAAHDAASSALGITQGGGQMDNDKDKGKGGEKEPSQAQILAAAISAGIGPAIQSGMKAGLSEMTAAIKASSETNVKVLAALEKLETSTRESQSNLLSAIESLAGIEAATVSAADATTDSTADSTQDATYSAGADGTKDATDATQDGTADATMDSAGDPSIDATPGTPGNLNPDASSHAKSQSKSGASGQLKAERDRQAKNAGGKRERVANIAAAAEVIGRLHAKVASLEKDKAKLERRVDAVQAQSEKFSARIERKSLSPELSTLLAKGGVNVSDVLAAGTGGSRKPMTVAEFDAIMERCNLNLPPVDKMRFKNEMFAAGAMQDEIVERPWMRQ